MGKETEAQNILSIYWVEPYEVATFVEQNDLLSESSYGLTY